MDLDGPAIQEEKDDNEGQEPAEAAAQVDTLATTSSGASRPGSLLGAEVPVPLLAIEYAKSEEYYKAADMSSGVLDRLREQLQQHLEALRAEWVHSKDLYMLCRHTSEHVAVSLFKSQSGDHGQPW